MKKILVIILILSVLLLSSCDFVKERFLNGEPLYGGGHLKGTQWTQTPEPTEKPAVLSQ